jgi:hypothetical protein
VNDHGKPYEAALEGAYLDALRNMYSQAFTAYMKLAPNDDLESIIRRLNAGLGRIEEIKVRMAKDQR